MCSADQNASTCLFLSCIQIEWQQRQFVVVDTSPKHALRSLVFVLLWPGRLAKVLSDEIYERICWALRTAWRLWFSFQPNQMIRLWRLGARVFCCFEGAEQFASVGVSQHGPTLLGLFLELVLQAHAAGYVESHFDYQRLLQNIFYDRLPGYPSVWIWSDGQGVLPSRRSILES